MYTVNTEHYCGLPQELWNSVASEAEDLLVEQEIGQHLLGVYPAGNRIYGIESSSQGLLCLYIDTVESLLDPSIPQEWKFHKYNIGNQNSPIYFIELHSWVRWICQRVYEYNNDQSRLFLDFIPCVHDVIYQDTSIDKIVSFATEILFHEIRYRQPFRPWSSCPGVLMKSYPGIQEINDYLLHARTFLILLREKKFIPNINSEHGFVHDFTGELGAIDDEIRFHILNRQQISLQEIDKYLESLFTWKREMAPIYHMPSNYIKPLAEETIKLYKALS